MTHLRQKMLDELQRRNYSQNTISTYLHAVEDFSRFSPLARQIGTGSYPAVSGLSVSRAQAPGGTIALCTAALRFLYVKTCDARISPSTFHFPSVPGNFPLSSAQQKFSG